MLENEPTNGVPENAASASEGMNAPSSPARRTRRKAAASEAAPASAAESGAGTSADAADDAAGGARPAKATKAAKRAAKATKASASDEASEARPTRRRGKATAAAAGEAPTTPGDEPSTAPDASASSAAVPETATAGEAGDEPARRTRTRAARKPAATFSAAPSEAAAPQPPATPSGATAAETAPSEGGRRRRAPVAAIFVAPTVPEPMPPSAARTAPEPKAAVEPAEEEPTSEPTPRSRRTRTRTRAAAEPEVAVEEPVETDEEDDEDDDGDESAAARRRRRRGRRGRGRGKGPHDEETDDEAEAEPVEDAHDGDDADTDGLTRRRRRRRRRGTGGDDVESEEGVVTVVKIREPRAAKDEVQGVSGSTRLEAKRQRRRDGRDQRRTRPSILSESEFLARREAVDRVMVVREKGDRTQIAVLEDGVLVEHYVTRVTSGSLVGNVYLGKVQNVLPSMEAAFVDIGRGRNAVLYAGEVNWDMAGLEGRARSIEQALKSGDSVLVQVTKDPVGHKGARLTSHIALSGRHLVYVPNGNASGISRKLSDVERKRLRDILKKLVPEGAGVIVRTAAEGASEGELERDVKRLSAQWESIEAKVSSGGAPIQLYEEPDLVIRVVRDLFNEDFRELVVQGSGAYDMVENYLGHVSPDLVERLKRHTGTTDVFAVHRIDEQIMKGLDRKVFLPSGGSLVIDRTEAMTVIDVNTGKYTGTGGNLEETVTRNNLESAEEIVRQLRLRDIGGIIVIDFIDMVLESNRELVLRRLTECLGRDRTKHQVTEITSLGLVQMTRKRIGQGLLEAFSETCEHCKGRGVILHMDPIAEKKTGTDVAPPAVSEPAEPTGRRRGRRGRGAAVAVVDDTTDEVGTSERGPDTDSDVEIDVDSEMDAEIEGEPDLDEGIEPIDEESPAVNGAVSTNGPVTTSWTPPATSSWVNLGASAPADSAESESESGTQAASEAEPASGPAASAAGPASGFGVGSGAGSGSGSGSADSAQQPMLDFASLSSPEIDGLESESDPVNGSRRRVSRWRLRP